MRSHPTDLEQRTPEDVVSHRARDDRPGLFGFVWGEHAIWTITFDDGTWGRGFRW